MVLLDRHRRIIGAQALAVGDRFRVSIRIRTVVEAVLRSRASGVVLAHNHPSGICRPSAQDLAATRRLAVVLEAIDTDLVDHLILGRDRVYSMQAAGLL